ncbi:MAG: hypothetical protein RLZZ70_658 [Candidatus Parcubacteria bacterium]|jgi:hypothetical protein
MNAKNKAIQLRKAGYSYSYIHEKTGLSKSTLSYHLATIPFVANKFTIKQKSQALLTSVKSKQIKKVSDIQKAVKEAHVDISNITNRDLFMLGIALYIGEGSKTQNTVRLVNSDIRVIKLFIQWLEVLNVPRSHIAVRIHGYPDTSLKDAIQYWSNGIKIPGSQFQRACIDRRSNKNSKRKDTHKYGTLHVSVKAMGKPEFGTHLARKITAYMDLVLG